jgi:peptidoglycan/xylan/chitin deacetylase (PgdA/CDA1 family)
VPMTMPDWARNGAYRFLRALSGPGEAVRVVLLYHSIGEGTQQSLPLDAFERQLDLLASRFRIVRLDELRDSLRSATPNDNLVAITFDDGFLDNFETALPALERYRLPATFFVATGYLGGRFETSDGALPMMSAEQVKELAVRGYEIGAHTVTHPKLTRVSAETVREEMRASKAFLEDLLEKPVLSFAYPKGDYNVDVRDAAARVGFEIAVTIEEGLIPNEPDWLALPRVWVSNRLSPAAFLAKMSPAARWYAELHQRFVRITG